MAREYDIIPLGNDAPEGIPIIYSVNGTLDEGEYPNISKTVGNRVDINTWGPFLFNSIV